MGDMKWHCHAGIKIVPMQVAVKFNIPLVIWGEITWSVSGMCSSDDYVQYNKRTVFEHDMRGFSLEDMAGLDETLSEKDLAWLVMPSDKEVEDAETKGIYIGNVFNWDTNVHAKERQEKDEFEFDEETFEGTTRLMYKLDDRKETGNKG